MMWGDGILQNPTKLKDISNDIIVLNWEYGSYPAEERYSTIADNGYKQILCPGTNSWSRFAENLSESVPNVIKMADLAYKYNALGIINTNWGDTGHMAEPDVSVFGLGVCAAKAWHINDFDFLTNAAAISYFLYGTETNMYPIFLLIEDGQSPWYCLAEHFADLKDDEKPTIKDDFLLEHYQKRVLDLEDVLKKITEIKMEDSLKTKIFLAAKGNYIVSNILLDCYYENYTQKDVLDLKEWYKKYREIRLSESKASEIHIIDEYIDKIECKLTL